METKKCSKCKIEKPFDAFFKDKGRKIGIRCKCKECCKQDTYEWRAKNKSQYNNYVAMWRAKNGDRQHKTEIKRRYGLSIEKYNELLAIQKCSCAICGKAHDPSIKRGRLYVDHNHDTGEVRGLLCAGCNAMIGHANDDVFILKKAIAYLS